MPVLEKPRPGKIRRLADTGVIFFLVEVEALAIGGR
jgi:hypothetical protein